MSLESQNKCVTPSRLVQPVNPYEGTASPFDYGDPVIDAEDYVSMVRTQVFTANSLTKVVHEYRPDVGGSIPQWRLDVEGDLPTQDEWESSIKVEGYVKHTIGNKHQGPKISGKERCIYYRPDRVSPSDFMPLLKRRVTGGPF